MVDSFLFMSFFLHLLLYSALFFCSSGSRSFYHQYFILIEIYIRNIQIQIDIQNMQNIEEEQHEEPTVSKPKVTETIKAPNKILNTRYLNQTIYTLFLQKKYKDCLALLSKNKPDEFKLYIKALIAKYEFRLEEALQLLTECQVLNRVNFQYLKEISKIFYLLGKYKSSLEVAKDAYKLNGNDHEIFYIMGKISLALNDQKAAMNHFTLSTEKEQNESSSIEIAKLLAKDGKFQDAASALKNVMNFSMENPELFILLGDIYVKYGQKDQAIKYYENALERDPNNYEVTFALGAIKQEMGDYTEAYEYYTKAHGLSSNSAALWNNIAVHLQKKRKHLLAYGCMKRALFLDPFRWDTHANLGILLMKKQKYLSAQIHLRSAIKLNPDPQFYNLLGQCLCQLGDFANAERAFIEGEKKDNIECKCNHMCLLLRMGNINEANKLYNQMKGKVLNMEIKEKLIEAAKYF